MKKSKRIENKTGRTEEGDILTKKYHKNKTRKLKTQVENNNNKKRQTKIGSQNKRKRIRNKDMRNKGIKNKGIKNEKVKAFASPKAICGHSTVIFPQP